MSPRKQDPTAELSDEARALCDDMRRHDWDFERAALKRGTDARSLYRDWLESLGWNQSLAARLYRRKGSDKPVSRQAIEGQMKRFGVVRPPDLAKELAAQDLDGTLDALREVQKFVVDKSSHERLCCEQLLQLAETYKALSMTEEARDAVRKAAELADRTQITDLIVRAIRALPYNLVQSNAVGRVDNVMIATLQGWLPRLRAAGNVEALAYCLAYLAYERISSGRREDWEAGRDATAEAMRLATQSGSARAVFDIAGIRVYALSGPRDIDERIDLLEGFRSNVDGRGGDLEYWIHYLLLSDLFEIGRITDAQSLLHGLRTLEASATAPWPSRYRAALAIVRGDWAEADFLAQEMERAPTASATQIRGLHRIEILRHRGEWDELETVARWHLNESPRSLNARIRLAGVHTLLGRLGEVEKEFDGWSRDGFAVVPEDFTRVDGLCGLAEIAHGLSDRQRATVLYELLEPYRGWVNLLRVTAIVRGSVARYLGLLAHTIGDWERGVGDFEVALRVNEQLEAWPYLACTRYELARLLVHADRDLRRAEELTQLASRQAADLGMHWLHERAEALIAQIQGAERERARP